MNLFFKTVLIFLFTSTNSFAMEKLKLSKTSGKAPLAVKITGPARLMKHSKNKYNKWVGCSFKINWGDEQDVEMPKDFNKPCSAYLEHIFTRPGTYTVTAHTIQANPDDSQTTDWHGTATIIVE